jgi:hypothetical protein
MGRDVALDFDPARFVAAIDVADQPEVGHCSRHHIGQRPPVVLTLLVCGEVAKRPLDGRQDDLPVISAERVQDACRDRVVAQQNPSDVTDVIGTDEPDLAELGQLLRERPDLRL